MLGEYCIGEISVSSALDASAPIDQIPNSQIVYVAATYGIQGIQAGGT
jgi:hypothetical protein